MDKNVFRVDATEKQTHVYWFMQQNISQRNASNTSAGLHNTVQCNTIQNTNTIEMMTIMIL